MQSSRAWDRWTNTRVAKLVSDETTLNPKEAEMAVYQLEKVMERLLLDGHTVQLGELGSFSLTITSEACRGEKEVTPDKIKKLNLRFRAGKGIKAALENAKFRPAEDMMSKKK
ncbi:MAG: HU family DNA-binding protein [Bacteroidales bacterium]|nr:HU family DNA-binding protein [Bacteroidales bacterium]